MAEDKDTKKPAKKAEGAGKNSQGATLELNGDSIQFGPEAGKMANILLGVGVLGLVGAVATGGGPFAAQFQHSYLAAYMWGTAIAIGGVWWVTLQHLFGARASVAMRRFGELIAQGMIVMAVLALPLIAPMLMGDDVLYPWVNTETMHSNHALESKASYLSPLWVTIRLAVYFVVFIFLARFWLGTSLKQDGTKGDVAGTKKMQGQAAPAMIGVALSVTFLAFDLLMSLDPIWFSTIFGVYYFATCVITFHCFMVLSILWAQKNGRVAKSITKEHFHDLGKMMFAFTCFWTYIGFSQFMLIWYANIPEESHWYWDRFQGNWLDASLFLAAFHFIIPFFGMISRSMKRHTGRLMFWAVYLMVICWFDMHWLVAPSLHKGGVHLVPADFLAWVGVFGVLAGSILVMAKGKNLIATGDPRLKRALAFLNV